MVCIHDMANIKLFSTKLAMFGQSRKGTKYLRKYAFTLVIETKVGIRHHMWLAHNTMQCKHA